MIHPSPSGRPAMIMGDLPGNQPRQVPMITEMVSRGRDA
jgi:hypothetical protein